MPTYSPKDVTANVAGITIDGFAKGTFIEVDYDTDQFSDEVGADGQVVRIRSADRRGTIKFTLMKSSKSNTALSALAVLDYNTGSGVGAAQVKDGSGTSIHKAAKSWVKKIPAAEYSTEATTVQWEVRCAELVSKLGENLGDP